MDQKESLDLGRCDMAKKRKRSASSAEKTQHNKLGLGGGKRAKKRARSASAVPKNQGCKPDLGSRKRPTKREKSASAAPETQCKIPGLGREERSKKTEKSASGAAESKHEKLDLGRSEGATKRVRSASGAAESKRCKLDHSGTSGHGRELQASRQRSTARSVEDDEDGHLICWRGDMLNARYEVVAELGQGGFGKVVECIDHKAEGTHVAVKIARNVDWSSEATRDEIQVLQDLNASDPSNAYHCVQMLGCFEYHGHVCIVFELLGLSTFDFMRDNGFQPFSLDNIRHMAYQICTSVNFLHMKKLTHVDLKPDNIVLVASDYVEQYNPKLECSEHRLRKADIRIVDFGYATYDHEYHGTLVSTRPYRAPEVILDLAWSQPCDVWSIGCTLLEYYLGALVFQTDDDKVHLAMMERLLVPLPEQVIKRVVSIRKRRYFRNGRLAWDEHSASGQYVSRCCNALKEYMTCRDSDTENLFDLIEKMLEYDPAKRITLAEALEHPFFLPLKQETST